MVKNGPLEVFENHTSTPHKSESRGFQKWSKRGQKTTPKWVTFWVHFWPFSVTFPTLTGEHLEHGDTKNDPFSRPRKSSFFSILFGTMLYTPHGLKTWISSWSQKVVKMVKNGGLKKVVQGGECRGRGPKLISLAYLLICYSPKPKKTRFWTPQNGQNHTTLPRTKLHFWGSKMTIFGQNGHFGQKTELRHLFREVKKSEIGPQKRDPKMVKNGIFGFFDMISLPWPFNGLPSGDWHQRCQMGQKKGSKKGQKWHFQGVIF